MFRHLVLQAPDPTGLQHERGQAMDHARMVARTHRDHHVVGRQPAAEQTSAVLQREPELAGIFGVNVFSAQGAGNAVVNAGLGGAVQAIAFDATEFAIEQLREGVVTLVIAQKPFDMGYMAVEFAMADWRGVTSLPTRVPTGYAVITAENVDDPEIARFIYQVP